MGPVEELRPQFPIKVVWKESGEIESFENEEDLMGTLEDFDSEADLEEASVEDAKGRPVRLRVKIWEGVVEVSLLPSRHEDP